MSEPGVEQRLVRAALAGEPPDLTGITEAQVGIAGWRSLVLLEEHLPRGSRWETRVQGIRRRGFYSTGVATALAATLCERLAGAAPMVFGDLALASAFYPRPGDRPVDYLAIHVGPTIGAQEVARVVSSLPGVTSVQRNSQVVRAEVNGMAFGVHRAWPVLMAPGRAPLDAAPSVIDTPAGPLPVAPSGLEALRILATAGQTGDLSWLLDLAAVTAGDLDFAEVAAWAGRVRRGTVVSHSWATAHRFGVAPAVPPLTDPVVARVGQRLAVSPGRLSRAAGMRLLRWL